MLDCRVSFVFICDLPRRVGLKALAAWTVKTGISGPWSKNVQDINDIPNVKDATQHESKSPGHRWLDLFAYNPCV